MSTPADTAAEVLRGGGVIAYPTEGVFGLGCLPGDLTAIERILNIKQRDPSKGLILIAANSSQLGDWIELPDDVTLPAPEPANPVTWIVPASDRVTPNVRGNHEGVAVRITGNPVARAICESVGSAIISTSANFSGRAAVSDAASLHRQFEGLVDYIVPGSCGPASGPSQVRILATGQVLRSH